jgi:hypothetical protein
MMKYLLMYWPLEVWDKLLSLHVRVRKAEEQVAHTCDPSYPGHRDQEDHSSKPPIPNSSWEPISTILKKNRAGGVAQVPSKHESLSSTLSPQKRKRKTCTH